MESLIAALWLAPTTSWYHPEYLCEKEPIIVISSAVLCMALSCVGSEYRHAWLQAGGEGERGEGRGRERERESESESESESERVRVRE
jgi:hypothetical protein